MKLWLVVAVLQTFAWRLLIRITGLQMLTDWYNGDFSICCAAFLSIDFIRAKNRLYSFFNKNIDRNNRLADLFISIFKAKSINSRMFEKSVFFN
jgi:hypothetical protein